MPANEIQKAMQQVHRLERDLALEKLKKRKADTRRKIEFGGLVIKAGMDAYSKSVILGVLLEAFENIQGDETLQQRYQQKGDNAFMNI